MCRDLGSSLVGSQSEIQKLHIPTVLIGLGVLQHSLRARMWSLRQVLASQVDRRTGQWRERKLS